MIGNIFWVIHTNQNIVPGFKQVHHARFHAGASGGGDRKREGVRRPEHIAKALFDFVEEFDEERVEVAEKWMRERVEYAGVGIARAGAEKESFGQRVEINHGATLARTISVRRVVLLCSRSTTRVAVCSNSPSV